MKVMKLACTALGLSFLPLGSALAQNTSTVFGPSVNEGDESAEYRIAYNPDTEGHKQRVHYQKAINGDIRLRGLVQARKTGANDLDYDYVQAELLLDLSEDGDRYRTGFRFDTRVRENNRPSFIRATWINQWALTDAVRARFLILSAVDFGDNDSEGATVETRGSLKFKNPNGPDLGLELYSAYGSTVDFDDFDDQRHQFGPSTSIDVSDDWSIYGGALFGLTEGSPDTELRFWLTRGF